MDGYIGVFDSGVGGLTVVKEIIQILPYEDVVYLGDTARVPYGTKSPETVSRFSLQCLKFLSNYPLKVVVVACNTVSSTSLDVLKDNTDVPIIDVIKPGASSAVMSTRTGKIAVIGTKATISSMAYVRAIHNIDNSITVYQKACPLFVPIVEEGLQDDEIALIVARRYLNYLLDKDIDTVVLGCTHYPLLKGVIRKVFSNDVQLIDSAYQTSIAVSEKLNEMSALRNVSREKPEHLFYVTDIPNDFQRVATNFLGWDYVYVKKVSIDEE